MKRIICILLLISILCTTCLTSCSIIDKVFGKNDNTQNDDTGSQGGSADNGGTGEGNTGSENPPIPEDEQVNITKLGYTFFCDSDDEGVKASFCNFIYRIAKATSVLPIAAESADSADVIFGIRDYTSFGAGSVIGRYEILFEGGKLYITASDTESLEYAKNRLLSFITDEGIVISNKMAESNLFNVYDYRTGKITVYTPEDIGGLTLLSDISIGGVSFAPFNPMQSTYSVRMSGDYPEISASAVNPAAQIEIEQASELNLGTAKITVSIGGESKIYTVNFYKKATASVSSEIVVKGGAKGTITFVIDDGTESTATFMYENILSKEGYENINATFALITKKIATLDTSVNEDGEPVYVIDENGKYSYTEIDGKFDFWREILATGKADVISHTHTHTYEGDNDSGGIFVYKKNDGSYAATAYLPIGHVTAELVASNQIIKDLSGKSDSIGLILPGVGAAHSGYFNNLYLNIGEYLISRGTAGASSVITDYNTIVYLPEELTDENLKSVKAYMIEHFLSDPTGSTDKNSTNEECLAVGIQNWTDFMDTAVATGGWATFCIHEIRPDDYTGGDHHIYESQAKALFSYANAYGSDAWITSYNEAAKYYMLWGRSTVSSKLYDNSVITVSLDSDATDERLNTALTVRVEIPESWAGAELLGEDLEILSDEGGRFVYVDLCPGESLQITADGYAVAEDDSVALG